MEPLLDPAEVRVLGVLVEKHLSTPDYYPMTLNAITVACNQKTNRNPVVSFEEREVAAALDALQRKRLAGTVSGAGSRAVKYRHACGEAFGLDAPGLAALCSLMLRGPETPGELRGRTSRLHDFDSLEAVEAVLDALATREPPLVAQLPRQPGQKEVRYGHLLSGAPPPVPDAGPPAGGDGRVEQLEEEVAALRDRLGGLEEAFRAFRSQFE